MQPTSDNILSEILTKTTEYDPMPNPLAMNSLHAKSGFRVCDRVSHFEEAVYKFCAGSTAELRIKTLLSCIGDVDIMYHTLHKIALPPQPQYLPSDRLEGMDSLLDLYTLESLPDYPGYVRLHLDGFLTWNKYTENYHIVRPREKIRTVPNLISGDHGISQGPAVNFRRCRMESMMNGRCSSAHMECDYVKCIPCPCWPSDALDFIDRLKPSGSPSVSLVQEVRGVGCDVVAVAHPDFRLNNKEQWRMSFSRAELILVRSWTKAQQIVYHLLRYFIKNTLGPDNEIVSNYHLKTIMLWKCEEEDGTFWNESQLIRIVSRLISCLVQHLNSQRLQHYFIAAYNLFGSRKVRNNRIQCDQLTLKLIPFTAVERLVDWFLENYLLVAYEKIPQSDRYRQMQGFRYVTDLIERAISHDGRLERLEDLRIKYLGLYSHSKVSRDSNNFEICVVILMSEFLSNGFLNKPDVFQMYLHALLEVDVRLPRFFRGFWYLLLAEQLPKLNSVRICSQLISITLDLIRVPTASLFGGFQDDSPESYFNKAIFLLRIQKTATAEVGLLLAFSKACLVKSLESYCDLSMFYDAATAYLATLLYSEKQYQLTLDVCESITSKIKITEYQINDCYRVELQLLLDCDDISIASGFSILYEFIIKSTSLQTYDPHCTSSDLTPTLLAYFVSAKARMRCQSDTTYTQILGLVQPCYSFLTKSLLKASLSTCDFCLYGLMLSDLRKLKRCSSVSWGKPNPTKQTMVYSRREVSNMSSCNRSFVYSRTLPKQCPSFENLINRNDLISMYIDMSVLQLTDEYRALNHYRRGEYDSALRICRENLNVQDFSDVICSRPFNLLLDDDLAKIIDRQSDSNVTRVSCWFLLLYLKLRCLLDLQRPGRDIARGIRELTLRQKFIVTMNGDDRIEPDMVRIIRQRIRTLRNDIVIRGEERISVKEDGSYTTFFVDSQRTVLISSTKVAEVP